MSTFTLVKAKDYLIWELLARYDALLQFILSSGLKPGSPAWQLALKFYREIKKCNSPDREVRRLRAEDGCKATVPCGCGRKGCPSCEFRYHQTSWLHAMESLWKVYSSLGYRPEVLRVVLTVPPELMGPVARLPESEFRRMAYEFVERVYSEGLRFDVLTVGAVHLHHTANPLSGEFRHIDLNLLNLAVDNVLGKIVKFEILKVDFVRAQKVWHSILEAKFGPLASPVAVVHLGDDGRSRKGWPALEQAVRYSSRSPLGDVIDFLKGHDFPLDVDVEFVRKLVLKTNRKTVVWSSFMSNSVRRKWMATIRVQLETRAQFDRRVHRLECPHGFLMCADWESGGITYQQAVEADYEVLRRVDELWPWQEPGV